MNTRIPPTAPALKRNDTNWNAFFLSAVIIPALLIMCCLLTSLGDNNVLFLLKNNYLEKHQLGLYIIFPYNVIFIISVFLYFFLIIIALSSFLLLRQFHVSDKKIFIILITITIIQLVLITIIFFLLL
jgi:hypothetical protein